MPGRNSNPVYSEWTRAALAAGIIALVIAYELWPDRIVVDTPLLGLIALLVVLVALPLIEELTLPGGVSAKMRQQLREAEQSANRIADSRHAPDLGVDLTSASDRLPDYLPRLAEQQPSVGLAALRAELEDRLRETYEELFDARPPRAPIEVVRQLLRDEYITPDQADVALRLFEISASAASARVRPEEAEHAVALGQTLVSSIRQSAVASPRAFEREVANALAQVGDAEVRRRVLLPSEIAEQPVEADFLVTLGETRYMIEVRYMRSRASYRNSVKAAAFNAYGALAASAADEALIVVPDDVGIHEEELAENVRVIPFNRLAGVLRERSGTTIE